MNDDTSAIEDLNDAQRKELDELYVELSRADVAHSSQLISDKTLKGRLARFCLQIINETPIIEGDLRPIQETSYIIAGFMQFQFGDSLDEALEIAGELELPEHHVSGNVVEMFRKMKGVFEKYLHTGQDENCIFCSIISGEVPSVKVYEDEVCMVLMDAFPATVGQTLVIPKEHVDYIGKVDDATYQHIFGVAQKILRATDLALKPLRTCYVVEGFAVSHVHIRLHPAYEKHLLLQGTKADAAELEKVAGKIRAEL